jgi:hypothetical protein
MSELGGDLEGEPGLANSARPGQGEERNVITTQQLAHHR